MHVAEYGRGPANDPGLVRLQLDVLVVARSIKCVNPALVPYTDINDHVKHTAWVYAASNECNW